MIGWLSGRVLARGSDQVLIDVGGIGYVVHVSERTLAGIPRPGGAVALFTDLLVREDLLQLFGFPTVAEREWHRILTGVQGVGPRVSLGILGALGPEGVARALTLGDTAALRAAPGVGPKLAQRLVHELQGRVPAVLSALPPEIALAPSATAAADTAADGGADAAAALAAPEMPAPDAQSDALSALANLGYARAEAASAVMRAAADLPGGDTGALVRAALKLLSPAG